MLGPLAVFVEELLLMFDRILNVTLSVEGFLPLLSTPPASKSS